LIAILNAGGVNKIYINFFKEHIVKVLLSAFVAVLSSTVFAAKIPQLDNAVFKGQGEYRQGTTQGTYEAVVERLVIDDNSFIIANTITIDGVEIKSAQQIEIDDNYDMKLYSLNGLRRRVGEGYCFAGASDSISCHVTMIDEEDGLIESTMHLSGNNLYRIGSRLERGVPLMKFHDHLVRVNEQ
jgi:hypothetical protein